MKYSKLLIVALLLVSVGSSAVFAGSVKEDLSYEKYESLRQKIQTFSLTNKDMGDIKLLFPNSVILHENAQKAVSLAGLNARNHAMVINSYKVVYHDFIVAEPNADVLYDFLQERQAWNSEMVKNVSSSGMNLAWYWADIAQSAQYAYQGTNEIRFLDLVMDGIENAFEYTDDKRGKSDEFRNYKVDSWGFNLPNDKRWETEITLPGRIITPVLKFHRLVESNPFLKKRYGKKLAPFVERSINIIDQYLPEMKSKPNGVGYFVNLRTLEEEAVNHQAAYIQACIQAYAINKDPKYKIVVDGFYKYLMSISSLENEAYSWPYQVLKDTSKTQQSNFWKESITIQMLVDMDENGFPLSAVDKNRFSNTYLKNVHRGFASVNAYITPKREFPFTGYNVMNSTFTGAERLIYWSPSDRFNPQINKVVNDYVSTRQDLFPMGWFGDVWDATAYAYKFTKQKK